VPDSLVVWSVAFESPDPALRTDMTISFTLVDAGDGTDVVAVHEGLPTSVSAADNEQGWRMSLGKLARLVERGAA
jgi:uncharacterized protein YndB with AHSA1/START domain